MPKKEMKKPAEMLVVKSKVKDYIKSVSNFNVSSEFYDALNEEVGKLITKAIKRTKHNNRKTVSSRDV